jgi:predicted outer membrane repeat protein
MRKRITSLFLVLALCLTLLPTAALAEASSLAAQEARGGTENGEDYTVGEDTAVRARTRAAATGEVYRISNADDLEAFCKRVNGGESSLNAVLVKDVSRNKNYSWESIKGYTGVFDGNGHTITLRVGGRGENNALFGSIASGGTVQDLTIQIYNWSVNISSATGSIAYSNNGTIQRCQALDWTGEKNIGGIVYHNESEGVVKDCRAGTLTLSKSRENLVGGIAFINDGLIQDCYVSGRLQSTSSGPRGDLSSATAIVRTNSGTVENCYYLQYDGETAVAGTPVTDEAAFASGEVAYKLNGERTETDSVWRQNLPGNKDGADADGLPVADASHGRVYYDSESGSYYSLISHLHEGEELTAWQQTDSLPDASGMYYLTGNVTLTSGQALGNDVTLCVNGHSVTGNVTVTGGSFTLTDCGSGSLTGDVTVNEGGSFTLEDCALSGKIENSGTLTVTGGTVTAADGIGVENKGTFTMNSGTITAAGTGVVNNGTLTMNGGAVTGCGKGVENSGTMDVSGDVRIAGNTNGNLLLPEGITVTVGTLDSTANIGVTAEKQSELTAGGSIRLTSGGAAYTTRFFADDAAAYAIFADGEDLVMRTLGEHTHCICGHPADGAGDIGDHTTHADVTFQPWTSGNSLPTTGNYYLTQNVVLNGMTVLTGTLCLNGYTISAKDGGCPVEVSSGVLNLTDCAAQPGSVTAAKDQAIDVYSAANIFNGVIRGGSGSGIYIGPFAANGNVTIYGGKITGSGTGAAANNGTMHMYGGEISGNSRGVQAGGTKGNGSFNGSFYLHGGKVTDNHGSEGGGVYVMNSFYMDGGEVSNNSATGNGGGIYMSAGYFDMSGGKVTGNRAGGNGGGVCTKAFRDVRSRVYLSGSAEISDNYAGGSGGGVYLDVFFWESRPNDYSNYCLLSMDGGKITGNTSVGEGGGVYADARSGNWRTKSVVMVQGSAQITGNKKGEEDNNLYLPGPSGGVTIHGDLDENADIRVTTETKPSEGSEITIAKRGGLGAPEKVTVPDGAFKVDGADGTIRIGEDGSTVKLVPHTHVWTYALKSGTTDTITAVCSGCNASGGSVTIKAPAELTYSGGDKEATLDDQLTTGVTVSASDIGYRMGESLTGSLPAGSYPRNVGTYTASITLGEGTGAATASVRYAITPATITVTPNTNQSKTYGADEPELTYDVSGAVNNETPAFEGALAREPGADAGEYTINLGTLKLVDGENFRSNNYDLKLADTEVKFTIAKNTTTPGVTLSGDMVYKKQQIQPTVTVKIGNTILEKDKDYTVTYGENKNAGKSAGTVTIAAKGNYDFTRVVKMFDITAQIIQVAAVNKSSRVGQDIVELTYTHTEGLPYEGDTFTGALETTADKDKAGTYGITKGTLTLGSNYNIVFTPGTYTVEDKLPQDSFAFKDVVDGKVTKTYGDADFTIAVTGAATGSTVTYASTDMSVVTVDAETGKVHIMSAGTTTIKATAHETKDYTEKEISYTLTVAPKTLTKDDLTYSGPITKVYDGSNSAPSDLTVFVKPTSLVGSDTLTITGSAKYNSKDVKDADTITFTPDAITTGNYRLAATEVLTITDASITKATPTYKKPSGVTAKYGQTLGDIALANPEGTTPGTWSWQTPQTVLDKIGSYTYDANFKPDDPNYKGVVGAAITVTVGKADGSNLKTVEPTQKYTDASEHTYTPDWSGLPNGQTWSYGCESSSTLLTKNDVSAESGKLTYAISGGKAGDIVTITLKASCNNYEDFTITLNITLTEKDDQAALKLTGGTTVVYGQTLQLGTSGGSGTGAVTYTITDVDGQATIDADGKLTPVKVGTVKVKATKAEDANYNAITSAEVEITITKATPTGEPKYTEITTSGKTLADAALTLDGSTLKPNTGTLEWVDDKGNARPGDTKVEANTSYKWRFTPADANYTTLTGSIELYHKSSSGGGGWYYTYHTIKATAGANGSISPSGWTSVREGWDQTFTITPNKGYAVAKVLVDGKSVGAVMSYTFKNVTKDHTIEAVFMKSNGNPQTGVFVDVPENSYYEEAVDWAEENGITQGTDDTHFSPNDICTRAQAVTFLWRTAGSPAPKSTTMPFTDIPTGSYYYNAVLWAVENDITKGTSGSTFSPDAICSRAQIITFLWRSEKSPAAGTANPFVDVKSTAYYADAVLWAVKKGITMGTTSTTFSPDADCTRAQIVTFLWRTMAE